MTIAFPCNRASPDTSSNSVLEISTACWQLEIEALDGRFVCAICCSKWCDVLDLIESLSPSCHISEYRLVVDNGTIRR